MAIFKCQMCGASLELEDGVSTIKCEYCDSVQTVPGLDGEPQKEAVKDDAMVKRGQFALEDGDWDKANEYFERALDENPENAEAYIGKVLLDLHLSKVEQINEKIVMLDGNKNFERAMQFSAGADREKLEHIRQINQAKIKKREQERIDRLKRERAMAAKRQAEEKKDCANRRKHNLKVLFIWLILLGGMTFLAAICGILEFAMITSNGMFEVIIGGFLFAVLDMAIFCGATIVTTPFAIMFAGERGRWYVASLVPLLVFSVWGMFVNSIIICRALIEWPIEPGSLAAVVNILVHAICLVMPFFAKKPRPGKTG